VAPCDRARPWRGRLRLPAKREGAMLRTRLWMGAVLIALAAGVLVLDGWCAPYFPFLFVVVLGLSLLGCFEVLRLLPPERRPPGLALLRRGRRSRRRQLARPRPRGGRSRPVALGWQCFCRGGPGGVSRGDGPVPRAGRVGDTGGPDGVGRRVPRPAARLSG